MSSHRDDFVLAGVASEEVEAFVTAKVTDYLATNPDREPMTPEELAGKMIHSWDLDRIDLDAVCAEITAIFEHRGRPLSADDALDAVEAGRCAAITDRDNGNMGGIPAVAVTVMRQHRNRARYAAEPALLLRDVEWAWAAKWSRNPANWPSDESFDRRWLRRSRSSNGMPPTAAR